MYGINNGLRANVHQRWSDKDYDVSVAINSKRLRDREFPYEKERGVFRILALGDSFRFGFGVNGEDSYPKVLEKILNDNSEASRSPKYEVINAGVPGWGTAQEVVFWNVEGQKYDPDIVILCFFENDPQDNVNAGLFDLKDGRLVQREAKKNLITKIREVLRKVPVVSYLAQHSHFYNFVRMRALHILYGQISHEEEAKVLDKHEVKVLDKHEVKERVKRQNTGESPVEVLVTIAILNQFFADIEKAQKKLILFDVPGTLMKYPKIHEFLLQQAEGKIFLLDTRTFLEEHLQDEETTYLYDGHWNITGHRLAGQMLANFITAENSVGKE